MALDFPLLNLTTVASLRVNQVFEKLRSAPSGLDDGEVTNRFNRYGPNRIKTKEVTWWEILARQFKSPFVYLLFASFVISFWLGEKIDALMILTFVVINTVLGFYQEYKSETAVKLLKKYLVSQIKVRRGGQDKLVGTEDLVVGDVVILEPGDIVPADIRFLSANNLIVDEEVLTGESQPVTKFADALAKPVRDIYEAHNLGFSGTTVVGGKAEAVVFATGSQTSYAKIVTLTSETERASTFEKELSRFSKFTLVVVLATLIFIVVTSVAIKPNPSFVELALFGIALSVSVIPEALPVVTTFSLSIGALSLAKKNVVVKRLSAIEDLGSLEVLCSDKTGTLTENKLRVEEVNSDNATDCLLKANLVSSDLVLSRNAQNNAFDIALQAKLSKDQKVSLESFTKIAEIPFDPNRRRITALFATKQNQLLVTRGAPEDVLAISRLSETRKKKLLAWAAKMGRDGKRVLAVAETSLQTITRKAILSYEKDLTFLGFVVFSDPIKKSAYAAISEARKLGVRVMILTGDSPEVAASVARQVQLITSDDSVLTGKDFELLTSEQKHKAVDDYAVFARITPQQKYDIIKLLQEKYSVGFLGEGINDAPALKIANVAIVVSGASDVAKEASDIVLLERSLKVILDGIEGGRRVFENTSKYIKATMASNFGNFFAVAMIAPFITFLPMLPLQILLVNLLSDFPMIAVATDNVDDDLLRIPRRYNLKGFASAALSFGAISTAFDFVLFSSFVGKGEAELQTYWFIESILSELLFLFSIRSANVFFKTRAPSKTLVYLTIATIIITLAIPFTAVGRSFFGFVVPELTGLITVFAIVFLYLVSNEFMKLILRRLNQRKLTLGTI